SSRRRHTRFSRDWSQTCALPIFLEVLWIARQLGTGELPWESKKANVVPRVQSELRRTHLPQFRRLRVLLQELLRPPVDDGLALEIGRASCRERVQDRAGAESTDT